MADPLLDVYGIEDPDTAGSLLDRDGNVLPSRPRATGFEELPVPAPAAPGWMDARNTVIADPSGDPNAELAAQVVAYDQQQAAADDQAIQGNLGMGIAEGAEYAGANSRARAGQGFDQAFATEQAPSAPNPLYPIRSEHAAASMDLMGQSRNAQQDVYAAQNYEQVAAADAYAREAGMQQAQIDAQQAKMIRDQQRREQAIEAERHVFKQIEAASSKLSKTPDDDRGRYWANTKWWQKLAWAISAMADGWVGKEPNVALNAAIEGDLRDQQAAREARRGELAAATSQLSDVRSLYADLRATIGDEDTTRDAMRLARYQQAKSLLMAEQLRNGVPLQLALQNQGIIELDKQINDTTAVLRERIATTPQMIGGGTRYVHGPEERRAMVRQSEAEAQHGRNLEMKGIDVGADVQKQERAGQLDTEKERAKAQAKGSSMTPELAFRQRETIAKETKNSSNMKGIAKRLRKKYEGKDIPGLTWGIGRHGAPGPEDENFQFAAGMLEYAATQAFTGASSPPEMQETLLNGIRNAGSEAEFWGAVQALEDWADADIERVNRAIDDPARADYENVDQARLPQYDPSVPRATEEDHVAWDD